MVNERNGIMRAWVALCLISLVALLSANPAVAFSLQSAGHFHMESANSVRTRTNIGRLVPRMQISGEVHSLERRKLLGATVRIATFAAVGSVQPKRQVTFAEGKGEIVLVVGATSTMGQEVCSELLSLGYKVRGLTRRAEDVKAAVLGTELANAEWVGGNLNNLADLAPIVKGVKKIIFAPLLATRAGLDPAYAQATMQEDIAMNRRIYSEAVGELLRLGKLEGVDKFVLVSSAGAGLAAKLSESNQPQERRRRLIVEPSLLNEDVIKWKLSGEEILKSSGVPYSIIRAYSPPPRPWNEPNPDDFNIAIFQGGGLGGVLSRRDVGRVAVEALIRPQTDNTVFQAVNVRKDLPQDTVADIQKVDSRYPNWKESLDTLAKNAQIRDRAMAEQ